MELLVKNWNGVVHGTNTGKLTFSLTEIGENPKGILRFMDDTFGLVLYDIEGVSSPDGISFTGKPTLEREDISQGEITINCKLTPEGNLRGEWESTIGTGGTFVAFPFGDTGHTNRDASIPEQIFTKRVQLGFVQLYKEDVTNIANFMKSEFAGAQVVVTYQSNNKPERINYLNDFIQISDISDLTYLRLFISEPERQNINRGITIELRAYGINEVIVQGMTEAWVLGRSQMMADNLKQYEDRVRNAVHRFFPALQILLLLGMIIWMTMLETLSSKLSLGCVTFVALYGTPRVFMTLFPNAVIKIGKSKPNWITSTLQKGGSWIAAFGIVVMTLLAERFAEKAADAVQAFITTLLSSGTS